MIRKISMAVLVIFATLSCVSCSLKNLKIEGINTDPFISTEGFSEYEKVSYMARGLLTETEHKKLMEYFKAKYEEQAKFPKSGMASIAGSTLVTGNPLSYKGVTTAGQIDLAFFALDLLRGEPHKKFVTKIYLPAKVDERELTYWEDASTFVFDYLNEKIKKYAAMYNYQIEFIDNEGDLRFVELKNDAEEIFLEIIYFPRSLGVTRPPDRDPVRDSILGFHTAWGDNSGVNIRMGKNYRINKSLWGATSYETENGISETDERYQNLMKILTEDGYIFKALNWGNTKYVAHKGKIYTFDNIKADDFINGIIE